MAEMDEKRLALIPMLAETSPSGHIGRTALMKYLYFLQTLRNLPLGYKFTLYSYGPFDADVLADLSNAESFGVVESKAVFYPGGYGYEIRPGARSGWIKKRVSSFVKTHRPDMKWLSKTFGSLSSAELELVSTIIYVDREAARGRERLTVSFLSDRVHEVKPHFNKVRIMKFAEDMKGNHLLQATR